MWSRTHFERLQGGGVLRHAADALLDLFITAVSTDGTDQAILLFSLLCPVCQYFKPSRDVHRVHGGPLLYILKSKLTLGPSSAPLTPNPWRAENCLKGRKPWCTEGHYKEMCSQCEDTPDPPHTHTMS